MSETTRAGIALVLSATVATLVALLVRLLCHTRGPSKPPHAFVPDHTIAVPCLGGLALFPAVAASTIILQLSVPRATIVGALLFLTLGIVDDLYDLGVARKLGLQLLCAVTAVMLGTHWDLTGLYFIDVTVTILWILLLVNALNLTDVCDGLAVGLVVISALTSALLLPTGAPIAFVVAVAGACLGFLPYNLPNASIFLGESGTAPLGFLLATFSLNAVERASPMVQIASLTLLVSVLLLETGFLVVVRSRKGLRWWQESPDHISLRLQSRGYGRWRSDILLWSFASLMALTAWSFLGALG